MVFRVAHDGNAASAGNYYIAFRHAVRGIVSPFGVNVRTQQAYKLCDIGRIKDRDGIYVTQRRQYLRTFLARNAWPTLSFESASAGI